MCKTELTAAKLFSMWVSLITENIAKVQQPGTPKFSTQTKTHKAGNHNMMIFNCQPIVKNIPSYIRNTTDFLQKLDKVKNISNDYLLVTLDVKSMYTNIPNNEDIKAVKEAYGNHPTKKVATKVIITFLSLILTLNNFVFNSINYLQIMGCAMGTICAPAYANIFMAQFEKHHICSDIKNKSILYLWYIDDIFMLSTVTKQELLILLEKLNSKHKTIKFEHNILHSNISFLVTLIHKTRTTLLRQLSTENPLISNPISTQI